MPHFGGLTAGVERYGGGPSRVEIILRSINAQMGTAYDVSATSPVYVRNLAVARMLADVWDTNERMGNQFIPGRMSEFLPRWERICALIPPPSATPGERRDAVGTRFATMGRTPGAQVMSDVVRAAIGSDIAFSLAETPADGANASWPSGFGLLRAVINSSSPLPVLSGGPPEIVYASLTLEVVTPGVPGVCTFRQSYDGGATWYGPEALHDGGGYGTGPWTLSTDLADFVLTFPAGYYFAGDKWVAEGMSERWSSTIAYVAIVCTKPATMADLVFYERLGAAGARLESTMPAWTTWSLVRDSAAGAGFYLDTDYNLDNQRFD